MGDEVPDREEAARHACMLAQRALFEAVELATKIQGTTDSQQLEAFATAVSRAKRLIDAARMQAAAAGRVAATESDGARRGGRSKVHKPDRRTLSSTEQSR